MIDGRVRPDSSPNKNMGPKGAKPALNKNQIQAY
jgi:hypothetical protein